MTTIFTHPAVAKYLVELDVALAQSPDTHADDLRDQVRDHIQDALAPHATDTEVNDTLSRLGSPRGLLAETDFAVIPAPTDYRTPPRPSLGQWLGRRRRSWWVCVALSVVVVIGALTAWRIESDVRTLQLNCETCGWYAAPDAAQNKFTHPFDSQIPSNIQQWTVPLRVRQQQTFTYTVWNPSRLTQRLIGGSIPSGLTSERLSLSFSTADPFTTSGETHRLSYRSSVSIPPHSSRVVRESWFRECAVVPGTSETMEFVTLRVKSLGIVRHERLALPAVFETVVLPTPKNLRCR